MPDKNEFEGQAAKPGAAACSAAPAEEHGADFSPEVETDIPPTGRLMGQIGILALLLAIVVGGLWQLFRFSTTDQVYRKELSVVSRELRESQARDQGMLTTYALLDKKEGIFQIPIERAMELLVTEPSRMGPVAPLGQAAAGEKQPTTQQAPDEGAGEQGR